MIPQALSLWRGMVELPHLAPSASEILKTVATFHGMSVEELLSKSRQKPFVRARWDAMYLLHHMPTQGGHTRSLLAIGKILGGLDHTTVMHGLRRRAAVQAELPPMEAA